MAITNATTTPLTFRRQERPCVEYGQGTHRLHGHSISMVLLASFLSSILNVILVSVLFSSVILDASLIMFFMVSSSFIGTMFPVMTEVIDLQTPKMMMIGMLGTSFWLTVYFIGCAFYEYDKVISWSLMLGSFWWYFLSFCVFFSGDSVHLERHSVGVKVKWIRVICSYLTTLPLFLFATKFLWLNGIVHFCVFLFFYEACLIQKTRKFRMFQTDGEALFSRYYHEKEELGELQVPEDDHKRLPYRILNSLDFFTE